MSDTRTLPNYSEIIKLSNSELARRTMLALDEFIQTIKRGGNRVEKGHIYNAHQDERLKRLTFIKTHYG